MGGIDSVNPSQGMTREEYYKREEEDKKITIKRRAGMNGTSRKGSPGK